MKVFLSELFTRDVNLVIVGAVLGLALTFAYDRVKNWNEQRENRRAILSSVIRELQSALQTLITNEGLLAEDLDAHSASQSLLVPLVPLADAAWHRASRTPALSDSDHERLGPVAETYFLARQFNGMVASREAHRLDNESMTGFRERMILLDRLLLADAKRVKDGITLAVSAIEAEMKQ